MQINPHKTTWLLREQAQPVGRPPQSFPWNISTNEFHLRNCKTTHRKNHSHHRTAIFTTQSRTSYTAYNNSFRAPDNDAAEKCLAAKAFLTTIDRISISINYLTVFPGSWIFYIYIVTSALNSAFQRINQNANRITITPTRSKTRPVQAAHAAHNAIDNR